MPTEVKIICGNAIEVLEGMEKEIVDTVYMCPSPFGYYEDEPNLIGGEKTATEYIKSLRLLCEACRPVLKETGSLFVQVPDVFTPRGTLGGIPIWFETAMREKWLMNDRLIWYRTEKGKRKVYKEKGFTKNYEHILHFIKSDDFYFNEKSKFINTSVFSYPLEDSYYTNEFDSGLPYQLSTIVIDTTVPPNGTILDPLCGSAKVGVVAKKMNRSFIGVDINLETVESARIRLGIS